MHYAQSVGAAQAGERPRPRLCLDEQGELLGHMATKSSRT